MFRRSLRVQLTSWAYPAININICLQALTIDISTPADIARSALETIFLILLFYGLYKCTDLLLIIISTTYTKTRPRGSDSEPLNQIVEHTEHWSFLCVEDNMLLENIGKRESW